MQLKTRTWCLLSLLLLLAAGYFWWLGEQRRARLPAGSPASAPSAAPKPGSSANPFFRKPGDARARGGAQPGAIELLPPPADPRFPWRLSNAAKQGEELFRSDTALLLRNAHMDTAVGTQLAIPAHLRAGERPGSYVAQARGALDPAFREQLRTVGATIVSYIPNNAYLVQATPEAARRLAAMPRTQSVVPFEPYYKISPEVILAAVQQRPLPAGVLLNVITFPGEPLVSARALARLGAEIVSDQPSPFGHLFTVRPAADSLVALAASPVVQEIEVSHRRVLLTDLARPRVGITTNSFSATANYLGRTGAGALVTVAGSGVETTHPALAGRVVLNAASPPTDTNGHDTHVAGIIAGAPNTAPTPLGSVAGADFRGMAHGAQIYPLSVLGGLTDFQLQTNAAVMNSFIFNGSFGYPVATYDAAAASYDIAVRDSHANRTNDQPITYVFAAGNNGVGNGGGSGGVPDSLVSPATAKNVISVGAIENFRANALTNVPITITNLPQFLPDMDSPDQVAQTSSRGNVGIGTEGIFGRYKPDLVAPGTFLVSAKATTFTGTNAVSSSLDPVIGSSSYRYESGTSMAAAVVSGLLALMQEHFRLAFTVTNSPAMNKALLINGARPSSLFYNLEVQNQINYAGWGLPHLTNTLPTSAAATSLVKFRDQSTNNALATGDVHLWNVATLPTNSALRITLVWTDPPGNPVSGPKLVNDLDLVVSNRITGAIYEGNNIKGGSYFTDISTPGLPPVSDIINNVENVYLPTPISTDFDIYVIGKRINVNAVTAKTNGIVQDYALVVSVEQPTIFTLAAAPTLLTTNRPVAILTNGFPALKQRVGANYPLFTANTNGQAGQWNFYVFTNTYIPFFTNVVTNVVGGFTNVSTNIVNAPLVNGPNVAISTFLPPNLARARIREADIDLYVARGAGASGLTNLTPAVVNAAAKSRNRGGTEQVLFSNAGVGEVFYIGIKAEDQQGGEFGLSLLSSTTPFAQTNASGQYVVQFFPVPQDIPDGAPDQPEGVLLFGIMPFSTNLTSFTITNAITHENHGDLVTTLFHNNEFVVLNNHTVNPTAPGGLYTATNIFDDYQNPPDGPGSAFTWAGQDAVGLWMLTVVDSALEHTGTVDSATLGINPLTNAPPGGTNFLALGSNQCSVLTVTVPISATSMVVNVSFTTGDIDMLAQIGAPPTYQTNNYVFAAFGQTASFKFTNSVLSVPPLQPGATYFLMFCNNANSSNTIGVSFEFRYDYTTGGTRDFAQTTPMRLFDNYTTNNIITNLDNRVVTGVDVGVRINHPRASDLVLHLISPSGTKVLLYENRGGWTTNYNGAVQVGLFATNLYANFTDNTNNTTVLVTNLNPVAYRDTGQLLPIKFIPAPLTNFISPPLFVNSNRFVRAGFGQDEQAFGAAIQGNALFIAGLAKTNATATNDGLLYAYSLPITNSPTATNLWGTNWPHKAGARNSNMLFTAVATTTEGVYGVGSTHDYFPAVPPSAGGFLPDVYDFDMGTTNGTLTITYQFFGVPDQMTVYYQGTNLLNTGITNGTRTTNLIFSGNSSFVRIYMNEFSGIPGTAWNYTPSVTPAGPVTPKRKGVVVKYQTTGPVTTPTNATSGATWVSRAFTNNVFGFAGEDRLQAAVGTLEGTNDFIYATGSAEIAAGKEGFVLAKFRTNGAGVWMATDAGFSAAVPLNQPCRGMAITHVDHTNIIVAGFTNQLGNFGQLWCYATDGTLRWRSRSTAAAGGGFGRYNGVTVLGTNIFAVGSDDAGRCLVEKWDLNGGFVARRTYDLVAGNNDELFSALGLGCSDRLYAVGVRTNSATDVRAVLLEINPSLPVALISTTTIIHNANQINVANAVTTDGNDLYVSGHTKPSAPGALDSFVYRYRVKNWYQPEESLDTFIGESSTVGGNGNWELQIWDNRAGAFAAAGATNQLICWDLNFSYAAVGAVAAPVAPATNSAPVLLSGQPQYFIVNVPVGITRATNVLSGTGNLRLTFNQHGIPVPGADGNVVILSGTNGGTAVLDTTSTFPPLRPGLRYYLAVDPADDSASGSFTLRLDFDQAVAPANTTPALASGIVMAGTLAVGTAVNYYQFEVGANVSGTLFELFPSGGNVDLYLRKAIGAFPPAAFLNQFSYDYGSRNAGALTDQILLVTNAAAPIPLTAGTWYVAVGNSDTKAVSYNVRATAFTGQPYSIVTLANGVPAAGISSPGNAPNSLFKLTVPATSKALLFEVLNLNGTGGDLLLRRGGFPVYAGPGQGYDFGSFAAGSALERVVVRTNASLPSLSGDWYLGVLNSQPTHLGYTVLARYPTNGILVSSTPLVVAPPALNSTNLAAKNFALDLGGLPGERYQVQYSSNLVGGWLVLTNITAPANGSINFLHSGALTNRNLYYRIQQVP